jgi:hypothetical protein
LRVFGVFTPKLNKLRKRFIFPNHHNFDTFVVYAVSMARQNFGGKNENAWADAAARKRNAKSIFLIEAVPKLQFWETNCLSSVLCLTVI